MVRGKGGAPAFYSQGATVPAGLLPQAVEDALVEQGKLDRITVTTSEGSRSIAVPELVVVDPVTVDLPRMSEPRQPVQISVEVGVMAATVQSGDDGILGTDDDVIEIRPIGPEPEPEPEPVATPEPDFAIVDRSKWSIAKDDAPAPAIDPDSTPDTAPTRKHKSSKRGKKTKVKS